MGARIGGGVRASWLFTAASLVLLCKISDARLGFGWYYCIEIDIAKEAFTLR